MARVRNRLFNELVELLRFDAVFSEPSGQAEVWAKDGWLTLTDGPVIDYERVYVDIAADAEHYSLREIGYDKWSGEYVRQELLKRLGRRTPMVAVEPTYVGMTIPMRELMELTVQRGWNHHGNPVATYGFDSVEVRRSAENPDMIKPAKPERNRGQARIDPVVTAALAVGAWRIRGINQRTYRAAGF